jgi:hypothetical protein
MNAFKNCLERAKDAEERLDYKLAESELENAEVLIRSIDRSRGEITSTVEEKIELVSAYQRFFENKNHWLECFQESWGRARDAEENGDYRRAEALLDRAHKVCDTPEEKRKLIRAYDRILFRE